MRRHLERAELDEAEPAAGSVGGVELVDGELGAVRVAGEVHEQVAEQAIDQPGAIALLRLRQHAIQLLERDVELVEVVVTRFVGTRRLAGRTDERSGEQVGQGRMVLPVGDEAAQHVGAPEPRAVRRGAAAEGYVVAAARSGVTPVEHELLGSETAEPRLLVDDGGLLDEIAPRRGTRSPR